VGGRLDEADSRSQRTNVGHEAEELKLRPLREERDWSVPAQATPEDPETTIGWGSGTAKFIGLAIFMQRFVL
jgi:hypothetical protein